MRRTLLMLGLLGICSVMSAAVVINEVDYDQSGTDINLEFIELYNNGASSVDISGYTVQLYNGTSATGVLYTTVTIPPSTSLAAGGFYVIGAGTFSPKDQAFAAAQDQIQNGASDSVVLRDASSAVIDAFLYENGGTITYTGPAETFEGNTFKGQDVAFTVPSGHVFSNHCSVGRCPDGADTNDNSADFFVMPVSPKASNQAAATLALPFSSNFATLPTGPGIYTTYIQPQIATLPSGAVPASPDPTTPNQCLQIIDTSLGGDEMWLGGPGNSGNINVQGYWYLKTTLAGGSTTENSGIALCQDKTHTWFGTSRGTTGCSGYESGVSITYTAGVTTVLQGINPVTGAVNVDMHVSSPETDTNVVSTVMAGDRWVPFRIFIDRTGNKLYVNVDNTVIYDSTIPAGMPSRGGVCLGYRQGGGTAPLTMTGTGGFFDAITINTDVSLSSVNEWSLY